jgi:hypothetical protein
MPAPVPVAPLAPTPFAAASSAPVALVDETETPKSETSRVSDPRPKTVIPGVNGAPIAKPPTGTSSPTGGDPFSPFKPITDAITNGIGAITGPRSGATNGTESTGTGTGEPSGDPDSGSGTS